MDFSINAINKKTEVNLNQIFDFVVIGLGPAGYSAGIYATRFKMNVLLIGDEQGGLASETPEIENYPGLDQINGIDLMNKMKSQYLRLGGAIYESTIVKIEKKDNLFVLEDSKGKIIKGKTLLLALGTKRRKLNIEGEDKFLGRGVSYCATCDAPFFKDKEVAVIGGGDSAFVAALHLTHFAKKVYIIHRRNEFRAQPAMVDKLRGKVEFIMNKKISKIEGKLKVEQLVLSDSDTGEESKLKIDGIFIEIGYVPSVSLFEELGLETEKGFIKVNEDMSTNVKGVFSAGDCSNAMNNMKQIVTAVAGGAIASETAYKYLHKL